MALHEIDPRVFRGPLTWLVMMRQAPLYVRESPKERVWLIFILERETELIIGQEIALEPSPEVAVGLIRQSMSGPMAGPGRRPALVAVESKALGEGIAEELKLNVQVSDRPLAEGEAFLAEMKRFLDAGGGRGPGRDEDEAEQASYFDDDLPPALIRELITGEFRVFVDADPRTRGRLVEGDVFLGRIVDFESGPAVFGVGPYALPLRSAGAVVESVRRALKTAQVTPETLRGHRGGSLLQREWNKVASARRVQ